MKPTQYNLPIQRFPNQKRWVTIWDGGTGHDARTSGRYALISTSESGAQRAFGVEVPLDICSLAAGKDAWMKAIVFPCAECGKPEQAGNMECQMCPTCYDKAGEENAHSDAGEVNCGILGWVKQEDYELLKDLLASIRRRCGETTQPVASGTVIKRMPTDVVKYRDKRGLIICIVDANGTCWPAKPGGFPRYNGGCKQHHDLPDFDWEREVFTAFGQAWHMMNKLSVPQMTVVQTVIVQALQDFGRIASGSTHRADSITGIESW